jgi:hypothetical protein
MYVLILNLNSVSFRFVIWSHSDLGFGLIPIWCWQIRSCSKYQNEIRSHSKATKKFRPHSNFAQNVIRSHSKAETKFGLIPILPKM